ncbi:MAG TPA: hypothetical protein V6C76_17760 [Drouetiella sp.]
MDKLLLLGVGNVAINVAKLVASECTIYGTTRKLDKIPMLQAAGVEPLLLDSNLELSDLSGVMKDYEDLMKGADILVSFPPDMKTEQALAPFCAGSRRIIYISSTGVYGKVSGEIDENSPTDAGDETARKRLESERIWLDAGAIVLRCPGLYGTESGWHLRLKSGTAKIPGPGTNVASRIHLKDLARLIIQCFELKLRSTLYLVGDEQPASHFDTISYVCEKMNVPLPPVASLDEVSPTLRGNRMINPHKLYEEINFTLDYPHYKAGYDAILAEYKSALD